MPEPTWRQIRDLTRLRRKQAATVRHGVTAYAHQIMCDYDADRADPPRTWGLVTTPIIARLWHFQSGRCYMCAVRFVPPHTHATREHVQPRARGGNNENNLLLACFACNNAKGDRAPTLRECDMLRAWLVGDDGDRFCFTRLMLTAETQTPDTTRPRGSLRSAKRQRQDADFDRMMQEARARRLDIASYDDP